MRVSSSSESRATSGAAPACTSARSASTPSAKLAANQPSWRVASGSRCTRSVTSVSTPSAPSEPASSCAQVRAGGAARDRRACATRPGGRRAARAHQVRVDPAVAGRGLAGRARRHAAADRRPLVALRHVAEREAVRGERAIGLGQPQPGLEHGGPRDAVDVEDAGPCGRGRARRAPRRRRARARGRRRRSCRRRTARPRRRPPRTPRSTASTCSCEAGATTASGAVSQSPARWASRSR